MEASNQLFIFISIMALFVDKIISYLDQYGVFIFIFECLIRNNEVFVDDYAFYIYWVAGL